MIVVAVLLLAPKVLREPLFVIGKVDGNCSTTAIKTAEYAEIEAKQALLGRHFDRLKHAFRNSTEAAAAFEAKRVVCVAKMSGYDPFLYGRYWSVECADKPKKSCGPIVWISFDVGYCGTTSNFLWIDEEDKCP